MFAFQYYNIARFMPYLVRCEDVPHGMRRYDEVLYYVFFVLNVLFPFFEAFT